MDAKHVERVYAGYAPVYDRLFGRIFQESRESAIAGLEVRVGERVLEVGVGTGLSLGLYPGYCRVVGIDLSGAMLDKARQRVASLDLGNVELLRTDACAMPFSDDSFDTIVAAYVVTVVPDYQKLMSEMIRVCRRGGRLVVVNHFINGSGLVDAMERAISPLCERIGFRTDLSVNQMLDGNPLIVERHRRLKPFGRWHLVECVNAKNGTATNKAQ
jgi:phosphatidylethanolamine/phosphatidyl-N-methylethanolamine N-methyltransferase